MDQLAFNGLDRLHWSNLLAGDEGPNKSIKQMVLDVVNTQTLNMSGVEALVLAAKVVRHFDPALFENKITVIKGKATRDWNLAIHRRVLLRVPTYSDAIISKVMQVAPKAIQHLPNPPPLREWYGEALTIIPASTKASRDVAFGGARTNVPATVASLLDELIPYT